MNIKRNIANLSFRNYILEAALIVLSTTIALATPGFLTTGNILNIFRNASITGIIAFGMTMVIICGQIDLSVGSGMALYGVVTAAVAKYIANASIMPLEQAVVVGMLVSFMVAAVVGVATSLMHIKLKVPTIIITLGTMSVLYGLAAVITRGFPITTLPVWYNRIGAGRVFGVPVPAIILMIVFVIVAIIMKNTKIGREIYAVGGNEEAARLSGINVSKVKIFVMIVVQLLTAVSGILVSSQTMSASATFGRGYELLVISTVIIGGTSINGGIGKVWGTFIGIFFLGIIANGMTLLNIDSYVQYLVRGMLILVAVAVNTFVNNRR